MKSPILTALCVLTFFTIDSRIAAGDEEKSAAIRLVEAMDYSNAAMESATGMYDQMFEHFEQMGLPPEALLEIKGAFDRYMNKTFSDPSIIQGLAKAYEQNFTPAEIEEMIIFYETPIGRKIVAAQPEITAASMKLGMEAAEKHQDEFQQEMMKIIEKHQGREVGENE